MKTFNYDNIVVQLLISSRLRVARHFILFVFILSISLGSTYYLVEQGAVTSFLERNIYTALFVLLLETGSYINIYVLTPKLLLKDKWGKFFIALIVLVLLTIVLVVLIQNMRINIEKELFDELYPSSFNYFRVLVNVLSACVSFILLYAGTSTFVLFKKWIMDMKQSEELEATTLQLELKLLENQINPHFLFNMLNNANIMVKTDPEKAIHIIGKLEEMLRYLMTQNVQEKVYLKNEIAFLTDFLELENTRRDYFSYTIESEGEIEDVQVAPLLFITFVENAVKHNHDSRAPSYVHILFKAEKDTLSFVCENSIPQKASADKVGGIGLANINRRLKLLYKGRYLLAQEQTDISYTVKLIIK